MQLKLNYNYIQTTIYLFFNNNFLIISVKIYLQKYKLVIERQNVENFLCQVTTSSHMQITKSAEKLSPNEIFDFSFNFFVRKG